MGFADADGPVEDDRFAGGEPAQGGQVADLRGGDLRVGGEVEALQGDLFFELRAADPWGRGSGASRPGGVHAAAAEPEVVEAGAERTEIDMSGVMMDRSNGNEVRRQIGVHGDKYSGGIPQLGVHGKSFRAKAGMDSADLSAQ